MKRRDIIVALVILVLLVGVIYIRQKNKPQEEMTVPATLSYEEVFEEKFNLEIPEDADKADLKEVGGSGGSAIAIRKFDAGKFSHNILADLPDPEPGYFYEAWLVRGREGEENYSLISTGKLMLAKGGWMLDFSSQSDLSDHSKVVVSLEKTSDKQIETKVLEGNF